VSGISAGLAAHLASGVTSLCRCWAVTRRDGAVYGFSDHDVDLTFEGVVFRADTGLSAGALEQSSGLAVDNAEALGALSSDALREEDVEAGRFDGAAVVAWLVNFTDVSQRLLLFRGSLGEISRQGGGFRAELRGLSEALNQPQGRVYQRPCSAVLGDGRCQFDLSQAGYSATLDVVAVEIGREISVTDPGGFAARWFENGALAVLDGAAAGLVGVVKNDRVEGGLRVLELWQDLRADLVVGDQIKITAGCDRSAGVCQLKFNNFNNFQGFPHVPGEDWMLAWPRAGAVNDGGSLT
jgi:uncharacterized phage protein (TIGR02218 family)